MGHEPPRFLHTFLLVGSVGLVVVRDQPQLAVATKHGPTVSHVCDVQSRPQDQTRCGRASRLRRRQQINKLTNQIDIYVLSRVFILQRETD